MKTVRECMSDHAFTCHQETPLVDVAHIMWDKDCGFLPVMRSEAVREIVGVITDRDVAKALYTLHGYLERPDLSRVTAAEVMTRDVHVCRAGDGLEAAHALMRQRQVRRLPVIEGGHRLVGVLSLSDLASAALAHDDASGLAEVAHTLAEVSCHRLPAPTPRESREDAARGAASSGA